MGIHLDWEVESDAGWDEIGEDPQVIARRRLLRRNLRTLLALVLLLLIGGAVAVTLRLKQVRGQLVATLEQTVAAETLALRLGDESAFMRGQANIARWRRFQEEVFDDYQQAAPDLVPLGEIIDLDLKASDARVVLAETLDGEAYQVVWYYHHDDSGWYHVPDLPDYWGEPHHTVSAYADISHVGPDELYAETLAARIDAIMARICGLNVCGPELPRVALHIDPDAMARLHWANDDQPLLILPSPQLTRQPATEPAQSIDDAQVTRWLVTWWSTQVLGGLNERPIEKWMEAHLDLWLNHELDPSWDSSGFFDSLEVTYGPDFVSQYVLRMQSGEELVTALSSTIANSSPRTLTDDELVTVLTANLRNEFALRAAGYNQAADEFFVSGANSGSDPITRAQFLIDANAASIQVLRTRRFNDLVWAEVLFDPADGVYDHLYSSLLGSVPFVEDEGRWLRVEPDIEDWGPVSYIEGDTLRIYFYQLDRDYALQILSFLEEDAYPVIAADFGLQQSLPEVVTITPDLDEYDQILRQQYASDPQDWQLVLPSPYLYLLRADGSFENAVQRIAAIGLLRDIFNRLTGEGANDSIRVALLDREMTRLGLSYWDYYGQALSQSAQRPVPNLALDDLWDNAGSVVSQDHALEHTAAIVLVDLLVERYGDPVVADLVQNLAGASTTTEWLTLSGIDPADIEPEWRARMASVLATQDD